MPIILKKAKKQVASNKTQTLKENNPAISLTSPSPRQNIAQAPIPFIDRISVVLKVPTTEDAEAIHSSIWTTFQDTSVFKPAMASGGFNRAMRVALNSVLDAKRWPHLQYAYIDKLATKFRIEFVPVDLGPEGLAELHAVLTTIMPDGWGYFVDHGHITRLDVAVDLPTVRMDEFHFLPKQGATVTAWKQDGALQTYQHGKPKGDHTSIYNRKAKRIAHGKPWKGKEGVRIERRLKGKHWPLKQLCNLPNPFASLNMIARHVGPPEGEHKPYIWELFLRAAEHTGLPAALALLPAEKRTLYRKHLNGQALGWWDVEAIWANWPPMLDELKIASPKAWI
ncbi:hypothetical protein [Pedomonas mirosovicensis]|uniref:hypothetical protein n=1 Tax=Pedomonas mirosovicensis TaxID=2908641 RepID=UPI0021676570|nr:hypothetical protein [Pedomonas mirosovicensis]MCH8685868.1 hypothetical protein [Pedomonas mirosovicensis]